MLEIKKGSLGKFKRPPLLIGMLDMGSSYIETIKIEKGSPRQIQMVITFDWDARLRLIIYQNSLNRTWKPKTNSIDNNF